MIEELIRRARGRFVLNETLAQLAFAAAVLSAGFVLMLVFGTRYLEWWTLALFAGVGLGVGAFRVYKSVPDSYSTAVRLDENGRLHDALSTAVYYSRTDLPSSVAGSDAFRDAQRKQAEAAAGTVQLETAVPFSMPRALYALAALGVAAAALIALRYGFGHRLDLAAPLTQLIFEDQAIQKANKTSKDSLNPQQQWMKEAQSLLSKLGMKQDPEHPLPGDEEALNKAIEEAMRNPADNNSPNDQQGNNGGQAGKNGQSKSADSSNSSQNGDPIDNPDQQQAKDDQQSAEGANPKSGDPNGKSSNAKNSTSSNHESLLARLKDAVSNILSNGNDKQQDSNSQKNSQQQAKNEQQNGKGQSAKGGAQESSQAQSDAQEGQRDDSQNGQQAQGKLNSQNQAQSQGGSGIGSQDGSKEVRAAAQLKAMGKISEIIGQRAATVTGETSVEVQSGSQKLRTDYSNTAAAHSETDGDVTRDEIPLALQAYVQQYFAQVHKADSNGKKNGSKQ